MYQKISLGSLITRKNPFIKILKTAKVMSKIKTVFRRFEHLKLLNR